MACVVFLTGCASPAQPAAMIAHNVPHVTTSHDAVSVVVTGGHKTDPMWTSQVSSEDFQIALIESLHKSNLFRSVGASGCPYVLKVRLEVLDQPMFGFDCTVNMRSDWTLARSSDDSIIWEDKILSTYTATVHDAFVGITRLRLANEGAARQNIEQGLAKLAELKFTP